MNNHKNISLRHTLILFREGGQFYKLLVSRPHSLNLDR